MNGILLRAVNIWGSSQRLRFLAVGAWNTVFGYACFAVLFLTLGRKIHYLWVQLLAHFLSVANAFLWHRHVTFRSSSHWFYEYLRFNVSYLGALAFGLAALPALVTGLGWNPLAAAAAVMGAAVFLSYVLHMKFSFRRG